MSKRLILFCIRLILLRGDYFFVIGGNGGNNLPGNLWGQANKQKMIEKFFPVLYNYLSQSQK
jgi:hypothetical protein